MDNKLLLAAILTIVLLLGFTSTNAATGKIYELENTEGDFTLSRLDKVKFSFAGEAGYGVKVVSVADDHTVLKFVKIGMDTIIIEPKIGETKQVDLDGDSTYDVAVTLNSITDDKAEITLDIDLTVENEPEVVPEPEVTEEVTKEPTETSVKESKQICDACTNNALLIATITMLVLVALGYWYLKKKRK